MDPIERINISGDSTRAMLEAQKRQHSIFYYTPDKLFMRDGRVLAEGHELRVDDVHGAFDWEPRKRSPWRSWTWSISARIRPSIWRM